MAIKRHRGGKHAKVDAQGYFGRNTAGDKQEFTGKEAGVKREFVGSGSRQFVFYSETRGILTVLADSFAEAWRLAKSRGYSRKNYRGK